MSLFRGFGVCACMAAACIMGCRSTPRRTVAADRKPPLRTPSVDAQSDSDELPHPTSIRVVTHETDDPTSSAISADATTESISVDRIERLSLDLLIAAVLERNPSIQAARAAWGAAAERYPQVVALDDPMLQTMLAPATMAPGSSTQSSYLVGAAQKIPWHGKRATRGQMAQWEAQAAAWDAAEVELRLSAAARMAYLDYYLVQRELELNEQSVEVMQDFRSAAKSKYEAGQVSQQDLTSADLELAKLRQQHLELNRQHRMAVARINTLLHESPGRPLPPADSTLPVTKELADPVLLSELAIEQRPELKSLAARVQADQHAVELACKEYYPDFEVMGRYDSFWTDRVQRPQVGMYMNVPLNQNRRAAAVREAQFRVQKLAAELAEQQDAVREEVQIAHAKVEANLQAVALFEQQVLPAAAANLSEARAAYVSGSIDFSRLMQARLQSTEQQIGYQRTLTELHRSKADLSRATGAATGQSEPIAAP